MNYPKDFNVDFELQDLYWSELQELYYGMSYRF